MVDLWERLAADEIAIDLGSDQTSCHDPFGGGYYPVQLEVAEANRMMVDDPEHYRALVEESLLRQTTAIDKISGVSGMSFWDYGNSFLLEASRAGADLRVEGGDGFRYPSCTYTCTHTLRHCCDAFHVAVSLALCNVRAHGECGWPRGNRAWRHCTRMRAFLLNSAHRLDVHERR